MILLDHDASLLEHKPFSNSAEFKYKSTDQIKRRQKLLVTLIRKVLPCLANGSNMALASGGLSLLLDLENFNIISI